ncbi:MAG: redoxin domain-containing protein [Acidimicrobiia bacterium]|nr:redoxin domain-containing protein [Acidimicrobiia bacterium]
MRFLAAGALLSMLVVSAYAVFGPTASDVLTSDQNPVTEVTDGVVDRGADATIASDAESGAGIDSLQVEAPPVLRAAPDLVDLDGWLQTDAASFSDFDAPVKIVQFWTFGCYNCKNTIPYLQDIYATYRDDGLEIIGVHAPEFAYEADPANIASAAVDLGVTWPIALDTDKVNFRSWQSPRRFWPRTYVIDADGNIRFDRIGEGAYDELEATVAYLLAEANG